MSFISDNAGCVISTLIILVPVLLLVRWFLKKELEEKRINNVAEVRKELLPRILQAYERLTLLLERVSPEAIVLREQHQGMNSMMFHSQLLKVVRSEFDHNLAMQVYVPAKTWELIEKARTELLRIINSSAASVNPESSSIELGRVIIENSTGDVKYYFKKALEALKKDVELLYR
jgi:flagellar biosynthesis/type III secretory pathway protein FliH